MKKLNKILALALCSGAMLTTQSCSEDFLDVDHYDVLSSDYMTSSDANFEDGVRSCYANMNQLINEDIMKPWLWLSGHTTMDTQATGWDKAWMSQGWQSDQKEMYDEWKRLYDGISLCNNMLKLCDEQEKETDATISKEMIAHARAEARAMRGFYYFLLAETWGNVPILKVGQEFTDDYSDNGGESGNAIAVLDEIISDLTYAADNLDWKPYQDQYGRATKGMAKAFLAEAYLWKAYRQGNASGSDENVTAAKKQLEEIINSGTYELQKSFTTLFDPLAWNKESIWEEVVDEGDKSNQWSFHTNAHGWTDNYAANPNGNGGWGTLYLSWEWYTCFEKGDKRRDGSACTSEILNFGSFTDRITGEALETAAKSDNCYGKNPYIDDVKTADKQKHYHCNTGGDRAPNVFSIKWWRTGKNTWWSNIWSPVHIYWKRYADVLLTYAECCFRTGDESTGWNYVNQIRERAFGQLEDGSEADLTKQYGQYYADYAKAESGNAGIYDISHFTDADGNLVYPIPFGSNGNTAPVAKDYYETVKSKLGFKIDTWQVALIQERRKEFNAEWVLGPSLHRMGVLGDHIDCNYPIDNTAVADLTDYPWTPRTYTYDENKMDFPIPATELLRNPNLTQNKAYR